jgi:hypothetical protein
MNPFDIQKKGYCKLDALYGKYIYLYPYARYAFLEVLKKLDIKSIYIPSFICRDMLAPINALNISYVLYEVDEMLNPILEEIECDVILFINYFGFSQRIEPFVKYKKKYGSIILEDNAHGFLSKDVNGKLLGCRGDIGLLSIRKTIFLPNGAALIVNNEKYSKIDFKSAEVSSSVEDKKYFNKLWLKKIIFTKYLGISILSTKGFIRFLKTGNRIPLQDPMSEKELPSNKYLTPLLARKELFLDATSESGRRVHMFKEIQKIAKKYGIVPICDLYDGVVPYEFAFIDKGNSRKFENSLLLKGFYLLPWPDLPDEVVGNCPDFYKNIRVVPFLW